MVEVSSIENSGVYQCIAINELGSSMHAARINIYGPPFVKPFTNISAISGQNLTLDCPYGGYPIESITWQKSKQQTNPHYSSSSSSFLLLLLFSISRKLFCRLTVYQHSLMMIRHYKHMLLFLLFFYSLSCTLSENKI